MVSFEQVHLRAEVQILHDGHIIGGRVRWKGKLPGRNGNFVGVELSKRVGYHSGIYNGIQLFSCQDGYGIFVRASQIRFPPSKGRSCSAYHTVSKISFVDESLFGQRGNLRKDEEKYTKVPKVYVSSAKDLFKERVAINSRKNFPLNHPIGGRVALQTSCKSNPFVASTGTLRGNLFTPTNQTDVVKKTVLSSLVLEHKSRPMSFISSPSIPKIHSISNKEKIYI